MPAMAGFTQDDSFIIRNGLLNDFKIYIGTFGNMHFAETNADVAATREQSTTRSVGAKRLQQECIDAIAQARQTRKDKVQTLDDTRAASRTKALDSLARLSRAANGARYTAKAQALSDVDTSNDALAKSL